MVRCGLDGRTHVSRHDEILARAAAAFAERGYEAVSVDEIGALAAVSGPSVYYHFAGGKEEILATLVADMTDRLFMAVGEPLDNPEEDVLRLLGTHARMVVDHRAEATVGLRDGWSLPPVQRRIQARRIGQYVDRLASSLARCSTSPDSSLSRIHALAALGLVNSMIRWPTEMLNRADVADIVVQLAMYGLDGLECWSARDDTALSPAPEDAVDSGVPPTVSTVLSPRQQGIVTAATRLFYDRGYGRVRIDDICAELEMTGPAFYRHFKTKADLLAAIYEVANHGLTTSLQDMPSDPDTRLTAMLQVHARFALEHFHILGVYNQEFRSLRADVLALARQRHSEHIKRWVAAIRGCHRCSLADLEIAAWAVSGLFESVATWHARDRISKLPELLVEQMTGGLQRVSGHGDDRALLAGNRYCLET